LGKDGRAGSRNIAPDRWDMNPLDDWIKRLTGEYAGDHRGSKELALAKHPNERQYKKSDDSASTLAGALATWVVAKLGSVSNFVATNARELLGLPGSSERGRNATATFAPGLEASTKLS
jgi:hypothetical protein